jgi:signal transduction histidine kinase
VVLPSALAEGIVAVVSAVLDNVAAHVGADARAWILLEAKPSSVHVSVRDEGPGIAPSRLDEAEREGRLGVASSIRGRVGELGGTAELSTGSDGTEWELSFPR